MVQTVIIGLLLSIAQLCPSPVIELNGDPIIYLPCRGQYEELGATAWSVCDGDLTDEIVVDNSAVNLSLPGTYPVTYTVQDSLGQVGTKTRQVVVSGEFTLTLNGVTFQDGAVAITYWECGRPYDDPGAVAWDDCDGDLTDSIVVVGANNVLPTVVGGIYNVTYIITNSRGQVLQKNRRVIIRDTLEPVIALHGLGESEINLQPGEVGWWQDARIAFYAQYPEVREDLLPTSWRITQQWVPVDEPFYWHCNKPSYVDPGVSAFDDCEGVLDPDDVILVITRVIRSPLVEVFEYIGRMGDVDVNPPPRLAQGAAWYGYRAYYLIFDSSLNPRGTSGYRTVRSRLIEPRYAISISGVGGTTQLPCHSDFDPRANVVAFDLCEGDISQRMVVSGHVDTHVPGNYQLRYDVSNNYGTATWAHRSVYVVDAEKPVITILDESGAPTSSILRIPWCKLRDQGPDWYNRLHPAGWYVLKPGEGWVVDDNCDDNVLLTNAVAQTGQQQLRDALEFLPGIRQQSNEGYPVNPDPYFGEYILRHNVKDTVNNQADPAYRIVEVVPTFPDIRASGSSTVTVQCGAAFNPDLRRFVTITDLPEDPTIEGCSVTIDPDLLTIEGTVDPNTPGTYNIDYTVVNQLNYSASTRITVRVTDTTKPVVTILPNPGYVIAPRLQWLAGVPLDLGAVVTVLANDECDGALTPVLNNMDNLDFASPRVRAQLYRLRYSATDSAGNVGEATLLVQVYSTDEGEIEIEGEEEEGTFPTIALTGSAVMTVECGDIFADPGATASDETDGDITFRIQVIGRVNTVTPGTYVLTYTVTNNAGNSASVSRTVHVEDTQAPTLRLRGQADMSILVNAVYVEQGVVFSDHCDGGVAAESSITGAVNTSITGVYTLTYNASDRAGNAAEPVTRTVRVVANLAEDDEGEMPEGEIEGEGEPEEPETCGGCQSGGNPWGHYLIAGLGLIILALWQFCVNCF